MTIEKGIEQLARSMIHDGEGKVDIFETKEGSYLVTIQVEIKNAQTDETE